MKCLAVSLLIFTLFNSANVNAEPQSDLSQASAESMVPVAVSLAMPVALLSAAGTLVVVSVTVVADGTVWVLERVSDGVRMSVRFAGNVAVAAGTVCAVTVIASGTVLSDAGRAIAFIPNDIGQALLYNERVTR